MAVNALRGWGVLTGLEGVHLERRDGYSLIDGFGLLLAYFCWKWPNVSGSCEDMLEHRAALGTFVDNEGVEPTNNHAARAAGLRHLAQAQLRDAE